MYSRFQTIWKLKKTIFIVARDSDTLQHSSVVVHEEAIDAPSWTADDRTTHECIRERCMRQEEQMTELTRHILAITDARLSTLISIVFYTYYSSFLVYRGH